MGVSRYSRNAIVRTSEQSYNEILSNRGVSQIDHYAFRKFKILKVKDIQGIRLINHTWVSSDRFYKLSSQYYGDPTYWWIIAYYNSTPLETDVKLGQNLKIPTPLELILRALEY
jgi:hypothetical protein|tara:strand:+ start:178 stop:519 length:342 start_codon:yes stop_codon:yes gene_type:complete